MKIVAILGTPHGSRGATGQLLGKVIEPLPAAGAQIELFEVHKMHLEPCRGCSACHKTGHCIFHDDFGPIREAMLAAQGVILASPNYIFNVSAQLKTFLDRCSCPIHCQALEGRYGAAVVTSGGTGGEEVAHYLNRVLRALGCWTVGSVVAETWMLQQPPSAASLFAQAGQLGQRLLTAIRNHPVFPEQTEERRVFYQRMQTLVTSCRDEWPYEYAYWQSRGRL